MLILKSARCGGCEASLPLGPGILGFRLAPTEIVCENCRRRSNVSFEHRVTWTFNYLWKISFGIAFVAMLLQARDAGMSLVGGVVMSLLATVLVGSVIGFIASYVLSLPVQLLIDVLRPLVGLATSARGRKGRSTSPLSTRSRSMGSSPRVPPKA